MGFEGGPLRKPAPPLKVQEAIKAGGAEVIEFARHGGIVTAKRNAERKEMADTLTEIEAEQAKAETAAKLKEMDQMAEERGDHLIPEDDR